MTRAEMQEWALSLKPGDTVIWQGGGFHGEVSVLTVQKVTPSGIVRTDKGDFKQNSYLDDIAGRGSIWGAIVPATPELLARAKAGDEKRAEEKRVRAVIAQARDKIYDLSYGRIELTYDLAVKLLELLGDEAYSK